MVMRKGQSHNWNYHNISHNNRGSNFTISQVKKRNRPVRSGGMPVGSKLHWNIKATETYRNVKPGLYKVTMKGLKTQKGFTLSKKAKYIRPRR